MGQVHLYNVGPLLTRASKQSSNEIIKASRVSQITNVRENDIVYYNIKYTRCPKLCLFILVPILF